jgi:hypothetical protein
VQGAIHSYTGMCYVTIMILYVIIVMLYDTSLSYDIMYTISFKLVLCNGIMQEDIQHHGDIRGRGTKAPDD